MDLAFVSSAFLSGESGLIYKTPSESVFSLFGSDLDAFVPSASNLCTVSAASAFDQSFVEDGLRSYKRGVVHL